MIKKCFKPLKIKNPNSNQYLARLKQGQNIEIELDKNLFPDAVLETTCDFLKIAKNNKSLSFTVSQDLNIQDWLCHSCLFLGEIIIKSSFSNSNIIVIAESSNAYKSNTISVVNPLLSNIRIFPGDVLEIVLFDQSLEINEQDWSFEFRQKTEGGVDFLGESFVKLDEENPHCLNYEYCKFPRTNLKTNKYGQPLLQKHMWFRFDKKMMSLLNKNDKNCHYIGDFKFVGKNPNSTFSLSVFSVLNKKYKMKLLNTLLLPKFVENNNQLNFDDKKYFYIKEVNFTSILFDDLFEGCRTVDISKTYHCNDQVFD